MDFLEPLNKSLFLLVNADPATPIWRIHAALLVANKLILLVPLVLTALWLWGNEAQRSLTLKILVSIGAAMCISALIGTLWPHPRPFTLGLGHAFFHHKATPSFPSNHTIIIATMAFALIFDRRWAGWGVITLLLAAIIGTSRVYLGVHFPLDIAGGLVLAPVAAGVAIPVWNLVGTPLTGLLQTIYRKVLALPIARGWIRA